MTARGPAVGIDLGTSNSVVAVIDRDGAPRILTTEQQIIVIAMWL
jgi:molecular chaperone DnaK (HSP70)